VYRADIYYHLPRRALENHGYQYLVAVSITKKSKHYSPQLYPQFVGSLPSVHAMPSSRTPRVTSSYTPHFSTAFLMGSWWCVRTRRTGARRVRRVPLSTRATLRVARSSLPATRLSHRQCFLDKLRYVPCFSRASLIGAFLEPP